MSDLWGITDVKLTKRMANDCAHEVLEGLWLGNEESGESLEALSERGISHVLVAGRGLKAHFPSRIRYLVLPVWDWSVEDLLRFAIPAILFILDGKRQRSAVLVHCRAGQSRSVTLVAMFTMWAQHWNAADTLAYLKKRRSCIGPNLGFRYQLLTFERLLHMQVTEVEKSFLKERTVIYVPENLKPPRGISLTLLWRRLLLASEMAQQRHYRLKIEHNDDGIESFDYIREGPSSALLKEENSNVDQFACNHCNEILFDELDQLPTSSVLEPETESLTLKTCLEARQCSCDSVNCIHRNVYHLRLHTCMIVPQELSRHSPAKILKKGSTNGEFHCPSCSEVVGGWDWEGYATCRDCKCFSTPVFSVRKDCVHRERR